MLQKRQVIEEIGISGHSDSQRRQFVMVLVDGATEVIYTRFQAVTDAYEVGTAEVF